MRRAPDTVSELADLVDEVASEFADLARCSEEDIEDELHDYAFEFDGMAQDLRRLRGELTGADAFCQRDGLRFMHRARTLRALIPFYHLVEIIDGACRAGVTGK